jgi:hypothetical protein
MTELVSYRFKKHERKNAIDQPANARSPKNMDGV